MAKQPQRVWMPGDFAEALLRVFSPGMSYPPAAAWVVINDKPQRVEVVRLRGACDDWFRRGDYADLSDGRSVSSFYLFPTRPRLERVEDEYGVCSQWVSRSSAYRKVLK